MLYPTRVKSVTIPAGSSVSEGAHVTEMSLVGVYMPAAWTAAGLALEVSTDNATWLPVYNTDGGSVYAATVGTSRYVPINRALTLGAIYLRVRSGTTAVPVNQVAAAVIGLGLVPNSGG